MTVIQRVEAGPHGHWVVLPNHGDGVTHLAWQWNGGMTLTYLCCTEPMWLEDVILPPPELNVSCLACMGTIV
jgi:hypothetical protein